MKKILLFLFSIGVLFASEIKIAVAANMTYALEELTAKFNKVYPSIQVLPVISGSGSLTAQIKNGAPYDLFLSANMKYPQTLYDANLTTSKPKVYARGKLSLVSRKFKNLSDLASVLKKTNNISIANPNIAPYGQASVEVLKNLNIYESVKKKLVYGQSIAQAFAYVLKVADAGFVATSSLHSPKLRGIEIFSIDMDENLYAPINQGVVMLKSSKSAENASKFYDFLFSDTAKQILKKYGYSIE